MRLAAAGAVAVVLFTASAASADVRISVKNDGTKVIYNVGRSVDPRLSDMKWLAKQHDRRSRFDPYIERYAEQYGVDPVLVRAVIQIESNFDPRSVSRKGARGLMQLMPATAKRYRVKDPHDPEQGIRGGIHYLSDLLRMFPNDLRRVLAAYNAGEGAVQRHGGIPPYAETKTYVARGLTVYHGRVPGEPLFYRGRPGGPKLRGGFTGRTVTAAVLPGVKVLGTR
ncbi:MAG: lytic transglycosylase domain-containing protein [Thermoanaerobaculia bacterium]